MQKQERSRFCPLQAVSSLFYYHDKTPWPNTAYKRKRLIWGSWIQIEPIDIMVGSLAASRQAWPWSSNWELFIYDPQARGRQRETDRNRGRGREIQTERQRKAALACRAWSFETPKSISSVAFSNKTMSPSPSQSSLTNCTPSIQMYEPMQIVLTQTTTRAIDILSTVLLVIFPLNMHYKPLHSLGDSSTQHSGFSWERQGCKQDISVAWPWLSASALFHSAAMPIKKST